VRALTAIGFLATTLVVLLGAPEDAHARNSHRRCWSPHTRAEAPGHLVSEFTTRFKADNFERAYNVRRAAQRLDDVVLKPYASLSYNRVVGPRTEETGFEYAPVIFQGELKYKPGGGVCQPSSTLHAAAILGGLKVVERKPHTWQSVYMPPGYDAAVAWGVKDLVIKNPFSTPVRVATGIGEGHLTIYLYSSEPATGWNTLETEVTKVRDFETETVTKTSLAPGETKVVQKGLKGLTVQRHLVRHRPGARPWRRSLYRDVYYKRDEKVAVGPAEHTLSNAATP
jgi:vancomycin resistance protein YoaR